MTDKVPSIVPGHPILAVILGIVTELVITITAVMTFWSLYNYPVLQGFELEQIKGMADLAAGSPMGMILLLSSGAIASMTGGYVCDSVAKVNVVKPVTAYIILILILLMGFIALFQSDPDWFMLPTSKFLTILMIALGAWLYVRKQPGHRVPQRE